VRDGRAILEDLHSSNGTLVNGEPIDGAAVLDGGMVVQVGSAMLRVSEGEEAERENGEEVARPLQQEEGGASSSSGQEAASPVPAADPLRDLRRNVQTQIQHELLKRMDMKKLTVQGVDREGLEDNAREKIRGIIDEVVANGKLPQGIDPVRLEDDVFNEAMRLGPLEELLADDSVTEVMVNGPEKVYVERAGKLQLSDCQFSDDASVMAVIERIVAPLGRRIDESQPYVDARLADGSRVNAIIAPLALSGPTITIRKFAKKALTPEDFIRFGTWTVDAAAFMSICVRLRKNIIVAGGTGSGKTTLLNLLSGYIPENERIVTVEDAAELRLQQPHVVRLEARPPNIEGKGAVTIRDLVKNCLRMRPDRIIVGECRGGEALDMLQAMNTGHDGSLTTVHANSPRDVISRLETMVLMSGMELPSRAIREQIQSAVDVIIHESRMSDGSRKVTAITEVTGMEGNQIVMQDIFAFVQTGVGPDGKIIGEMKPTGAIPTWLDQAKNRGIEVDMKMFQE
ncbi:MAG: Flp pilus assembly complex ATPase component TadA, partial [Kiritimatiellae bacterium]|nr:Flp pilus assembly complex ATPase component TadA [Kiritimatiellia bacterium]